MYEYDDSDAIIATDPRAVECTAKMRAALETCVSTIHALQYAYGLGAGDTEPRELIPAYFTELFLDYTFHSDPQVAQLIQQLANLANDGGKATLPLYLAKRDQLAAKIGQVSKVL